MKISMIQAIQRSANPFGKHAKNIYYVMCINKFWNFALSLEVKFCMFKVKMVKILNPRYKNRNDILELKYEHSILDIIVNKHIGLFLV